MKKIILLSLFAFVSLSLFAQQEAGDKVIRFNVNYLKIKDVDGFLNLNFKYGKFFTKNIEAGITPSIQLGGGSTNTTIGVYGTYNFLTEGAKAVPYAGAALGTIIQGSKGQKTNTAFTYGLNAGVRYYLTEKVNIDSGLDYTRYSIDGQSLGLLQVNIGLGIIISSLK